METSGSFVPSLAVVVSSPGESETMSEQFEHAQEHLEHAAHEHGHTTSHTRAAIIISIMAAVLAITEFASKDASSSYLTNHIAASNTWAQYQAKSVRRTILTAQADVLESLPGASGPEVQKRIADARANAERMRSEPGADGMEQLTEKAHEQEHERDHEMHRNHILEIASGGLQIAIVLASISVVINLPAFMMVSIIVGSASVIYALLGGFSLLH
jgi:hypothetical protein